LTGSITNDGSSVTGSDPGFLSLGRQEFRLNTNSACINAGTNLHPAALPLYQPVWHYRKHQQSAPRTNYLAPDLGAFEFSPFAAWQNAAFGVNADNAAVASEEADPDGDGVSNLDEYAFLMDPLVASRSGLPQPKLVLIPPAWHLAIQFPRRSAPSELTYLVETSPILAQWQQGSWYSDSDSVPSNAITAEVSDAGVTVVRLNKSIQDEPRGFLRVRVLESWR
jgi:hypothetical protein